MNNRVNKGQFGFTLIELLVVIGIIGILTGLATVNFQQARLRTRDVQRKNDIKQIQQALELYKNDRTPQHYPYSEDGDPLTYADLKTLLGSYLKKVSDDPKVKMEAGSWDNYWYNDVDGLHYNINACLENTSDPESTGATCRGGAGIVYQLSEP